MSERSSWLVSVSLIEIHKRDDVRFVSVVQWAFTPELGEYLSKIQTNEEKNAINYWFTKLAMITNNTQPIILASCISYFTNSWLYFYEFIKLIKLFT